MSENFRGRDSGKTCLINKELGSGGQGRVYLVQDIAVQQEYAAKWYKPGARSEDQHEQIQDLVRRGTPPVNDPGIHFIWPIECLSFEGSKDGFGYLMPLIDTRRFFSLNQICNGRVKQPSAPILCRLSQRLFLEMEANAPACVECRAVNLWDGNAKPLRCWKCRKEIPLGLGLKVGQGHAGDSLLLAYPGARLRRHHLDVTRFDTESRQALARVEAHPKARGHVILRNLSGATWG